jgi:hypothetical protein
VSDETKSQCPTCASYDPVIMLYPCQVSGIVDKRKRNKWHDTPNLVSDKSNERCSCGLPVDHVRSEVEAAVCEMPARLQSVEPEKAKCQLCGESMPEGEGMFNYHGYSGPCPKPLLPRPESDDYVAWLRTVGATDDLKRHLQICDSDTPGAFKVYRHAASELARLRAAVPEARSNLKIMQTSFDEALAEITRLRAECDQWKKAAGGCESPNALETLLRAGIEGAKTWQELLWKAEAKLDHFAKQNLEWACEWIYEDELPPNYPYDEMFPLSKLGHDGRGGVRLFPKVTPAPHCKSSGQLR